MEFRDLFYLLEVVNTGHIGRAAERLHITQPALTKCIARLERELGVPLLERTPKGVTLTQYGQQLARHAERLRAADGDFRRELMELATGHAGHIRIGTGFVGAQHLLPLATVELLKRYPSITLEIVAGNTETLFPALRQGKIDLVLAAVGSRAPMGLRQVPLMSDPVTVISRRDHPLQRSRKPTPDALCREKWVMPDPGTLPAQWLAQRWRDLGIEPPACIVRSSSLPILLRVVAETDLLVFQSWSAVRRTGDYGKLLRPIDCEALTWQRKLGATLRDSGYISPALENFMEILRGIAASQDAS